MLGHVKAAEYPRRCSPGLHDMKWSYHAPQSGSRNVDPIRVYHVYAHPHRASSVHFGRAGSCSGWCPPAGTAGATTPPSSGLTRRWASWRLRCSCCDSVPSSRTARSGRRCMLLLPAGNHLKLPSCGADSRDLALCWRTPVAPAAGCWWLTTLTSYGCLWPAGLHGGHAGGKAEGNLWTHVALARQRWEAALCGTAAGPSSSPHTSAVAAAIATCCDAGSRRAGRCSHQSSAGGEWGFCRGDRHFAARTPAAAAQGYNRRAHGRHGR